MRISGAFFLLTMLCAGLLAGCGRSDVMTPEEVVASWSKAVNEGDDEAAAELFADGAVVIQGGQQQTLADHNDAVAFAASLPCGSRVVKQSVKGARVTATFTLTGRPGQMCYDTGAEAVVVFKVDDGKITLLHHLDPGAASTDA